MTEEDCRIAALIPLLATDTRSIWSDTFYCSDSEGASGTDFGGYGVMSRKADPTRIAEVGRRQWRKESGAHQQARAENGMSRYKRIIGDRLRAKKPGAQTREAMLAVNVLNRMTALGMPDSVAVAA